MAKLNTVKCTTSGGGNTGLGDCVFQLLPFIGAFLTPRNFRISKATAEDPVALQTFLRNATMADASERIYPIHDFEALATDGTEQDAGITFGYGRVLKVSEGNYAPTYQFYTGGMCLQRALRMHNKSRNRGVIFIDSEFRLVGTTTVDQNVEYFSAIPLNSFFAQKVGLPTGPTDPAKYYVDFNFKPIYLNDRLGFLETAEDFDISVITGLQDVRLVVSDTTANSVSVQPLAGCANLNLGDVYDVELAVPGAWTVLDTADGSEVQLSGVVYDAANKAFVLTGAAALPANVQVSLKDPTVLAALQIQGYESNQVTTPVTA